MTNKRTLPASLTFNGASPLKKETFVTEHLRSMRLNGDEDDSVSTNMVQSNVLNSSSSCISKPSGTNSSSSDEEEMKKLDTRIRLAEERTNLARGPNARKVTDQDFERVIVLGTGSFAKVVLVKCLLGADKGKLYAMKVLDKEKIIQQKQTSHTMTERSVLGQTSSHPFIVSLKYAYQTSKTLNLVMDFCSGGELYYHLSKVGRFPESRARFYAAELTLALEHLHCFNVVYRDLKPENVLIASDGHIMLADFGLSKEGINDWTKGTDTFCGTPEYLAPEVLRRCSHGLSVDWWSLGIMVYEMLFGLPPWYSKNRRQMFEGICSQELDFPNRISVSTAAKSFITGLLVKDPRYRLGSNGVDKIKSHPFFQAVQFESLLQKNCEVPWKPDQGKIYFDAEYTKLPCGAPVPPESQAAADLDGVIPNVGEGNASHPGGEDLISASPLYPSSFIERAFSGFSYTDPKAVSCSPVSPGVGSTASVGKHQAHTNSPQSLMQPPAPMSSSVRRMMGDFLESKEQNHHHQQQSHPPPHGSNMTTAHNNVEHGHAVVEGEDDEGQFALELEGEDM